MPAKRRSPTKSPLTQAIRAIARHRSIRISPPEADRIAKEITANIGETPDKAQRKSEIHKALDKLLIEHHMPTIETTSKEHRKGVISSKIENLLYLLTHPRKTAQTRKHIDSYYSRKKALTETKKAVEELLKQKGIDYLKIFSRVKTTKSIAHKIESGRRPPKRVYSEALGLRIVVLDRNRCRKVAKAITGLGVGRHVLRSADYIKRPRAFGYMGIHIVTNYFGKPVEIQIRSIAMEKEAQKRAMKFGAHTFAKKEKERKVQSEINKAVEAVEALKRKGEIEGRNKDYQKIKNVIEAANLSPHMALRAISILRKNKTIRTIVEKRLKKHIFQKKSNQKKIKK